MGFVIEKGLFILCDCPQGFLELAIVILVSEFVLVGL